MIAHHPTLVERFTAYLLRHRVRGAVRLKSALCGDDRLAVRTKHGVVLFADIQDYVDTQIIQHGYYEEEVLLALTQRLQPNEVFWDVGANLGIHALTVCRLKPAVRAFAFEPNPALAALLRTSARFNHSAVDVIEVAVSSTSGTADFFLNEGNSGRSGLTNWASDRASRCLRVSTMTGDDIVRQDRAPFPNVIKIDVEGHELTVLTGACEILRDHRLHTVVFEDSRDPTSPCKRALIDTGFEVSALTRLEDTQHELENYVARR